MNSNETDEPKKDEPSTQDTVLGFCMLVAVGLLIYWLFFGGDRAEISRCIATAAEADRAGAQALGLSLRRMQLDVDRADEVTIIRKSTRPFVSIDLKTIVFTLDGREEVIRCRT